MINTLIHGQNISRTIQKTSGTGTRVHRFLCVPVSTVWICTEHKLYNFLIKRKNATKKINGFIAKLHKFV